MKKRILILTLNGDETPNDGYRKQALTPATDHVKRFNHHESSAVSKRVILVDDDSQIRNMLQSLLRMKGFEIAASLSDGQDLVELIDEINPKPDTILLDERMPRMSGVAACREIHSKYPRIQIVFVSADDTAAPRAIEAGASAFLKKPVSVSELVSLIS